MQTITLHVAVPDALAKVLEENQFVGVPKLVREVLCDRHGLPYEDYEASPGK